MADLQRTRAELETLFADNNNAEISAQDLRDFLKSVYVKTEVEALINNAVSEMQAYVAEKNATYIHTQVSPATTWTINHNLNKYPSVLVFSGINNQTRIDTKWNYVDENHIIVNFLTPRNGVAYLN